MQQDIFDVTFDILIKSLTLSPIDKAKSLDEDEGSVLYLSFQFRHWKFYYLFVWKTSERKKIIQGLELDLHSLCRISSFLFCFFLSRFHE